MRQLGIDASSCVLITVPLHAPRAVSMLLTTLYAGGRCVLAPAAHPEFITRLIEHELVTVADVRPAVLRSIAADDDWMSQIPDDCLLAVASHDTTGSKYSRQLFGKAFEFICGYGLKETGPVSVLGSDTVPEKWGSAGLPDPAAIVTSMPSERADGLGEIAIQSPAMMSARVDSGDTATTWYEDSRGRFYRTGVLGRIDSDGYLHGVGNTRIDHGGFVADDVGFDFHVVAARRQQLSDRREVGLGIVHFDDELPDLLPLRLAQTLEDLALVTLGVDFQQVDPTDAALLDEVPERIDFAVHEVSLQEAAQ
jgi:acyl-CoA synthetase (AMP-forming)/AMP-acid ligase II